MLVVSQTVTGLLNVGFNFPVSSRSKSVYFIKRTSGALDRGSANELKTDLIYGDFSHLTLEQLSAFVEEVRTIFRAYL